MTVIFGILAFLVLGGLVLRFSKNMNISWWKGILFLVCWIGGGWLVLTMCGESLMYLLLIPLVIAAPYLLIWLFKLIGRFISWALGGWKSDDD